MTVSSKQLFDQKVAELRAVIEQETSSPSQRAMMLRLLDEVSDLSDSVQSESWSDGVEVGRSDGY